MEHHVYFWLKEEHKNPADRERFEAGLASLVGLASVAGGCWSVPAPTASRPVTDHSWDYGLSLRFASLADHDAYQVDPDHDVFVDRFRGFWERVLVMDLK